MELNYAKFFEVSNLGFDSRYRSWDRKLFETDLTWNNITIVVRPEWDFLEKLIDLQSKLKWACGNQFLYWSHQLHTTIAFFDLSLIKASHLEQFKILISEYKDRICYEFLGCLMAPWWDWLVGVLQPSWGRKSELIEKIQITCNLQPGTKSQDPLINAIRKSFARMYLLKFQKSPPIEQIDFMKWLSEFSMWSRKPKEVLIYKTKSTLLDWAELLATIPL